MPLVMKRMIRHSTDDGLTQFTVLTSTYSEYCTTTMDCVSYKSKKTRSQLLKKTQNNTLQTRLQNVFMDIKKDIKKFQKKMAQNIKKKNVH